jgi:hypothetical protein
MCWLLQYAAAAAAAAAAVLITALHLMLPASGVGTNMCTAWSFHHHHQITRLSHSINFHHHHQITIAWSFKTCCVCARFTLQYTERMLLCGDRG